MNVSKDKEVNWEYCNYCDYKNVDQADDPCHECLNHPVNDWSHKPVNWKGPKEIIL